MNKSSLHKVAGPAILAGFTVTEVIGIAAGGSNMISTVPEIMANIGDLDRAASQTPWRPALQLLGNALWLVYGLREEKRVIVFFSAAGTLFASIALLQTILVQF